MTPSVRARPVEATRRRGWPKLCVMKSTRSVIAYILLVTASATLAVSGASIASATPDDHPTSAGSERVSLNRGWHSPAGEKLPLMSE